MSFPARSSRIVAVLVAMGILVVGCGTTQDTTDPPVDDSATTDCDLVDRAIEAASRASQSAIAQSQERKLRAEADYELLEENPKKYWKQRRQEAIEGGMDPEEAKERYNINSFTPMHLERFNDPQADGDRAYVESFTAAASGLWPQVQDPDLKIALRGLGEGSNQESNFRAIASICNIPLS